VGLVSHNFGGRIIFDPNRPSSTPSQMTAWKLFKRRKNGSLGSLFINRKAVLPIGEWLVAESHPTKGFKLRPFWHCMSQPEAPHLSKKGRVWREVMVEDYSEFERPKSQGGKWLISRWIKIL
jgi:hypothetical protein